MERGTKYLLARQALCEIYDHQGEGDALRTFASLSLLRPIHEHFAVLPATAADLDLVSDL